MKRCIFSAASAVLAEETAASLWEPDLQTLGPAAVATLRMLEWPRLCAHVARFSSTTLGRQAALELQVRKEPLAHPPAQLGL